MARYPLTVLVAVTAAVTGSGVLAHTWQQAAPQDPAGAALSQAQQAAGTAERFLDLLASGDAAGACSLISADGKATLESRSGSTCADLFGKAVANPPVRAAYQDLAKAKIDPATVVVTGTTAYVPLPQQHAVSLAVTDAGMWEIAGLS